MKKTIISLIAAGVLASVASAQLYTVEGGGTGVEAEFTFTFDLDANTLTVYVDNTIVGDGGAVGSITGFGFNVPDWLDLELVSFTATGSDAAFDSSDWELGPAFDLEPGYDQDLGVTGSPEPSTIQAGETATFVFSFNQDITDTEDFLGENALSVRFQSIENSQNDESSDKVFGNPDEGGGGGEGAVPEPSTYGMFGALALLGLMVVRRVRRS